ncbi:hypothetical protein [Paenirhodobacter sp.]
MVGFDFRPGLGYAHLPGRQFAAGDSQTREIVIGMQESSPRCWTNPPTAS